MHVMLAARAASAAEGGLDALQGCAQSSPSCSMSCSGRGVSCSPARCMQTAYSISNEMHSVQMCTELVSIHMLL